MAVAIGDAWIGPNYRVSQTFGANPAFYSAYNLKGHEGVDYALPEGTQVVTVEAGVVIRVGPLAGWENYGIFVEVWHDQLPGQKFATLYAHLEIAAVRMGQRLVKGQSLGLSGHTGNVRPVGLAGAHLHFGLCYTDLQGVRLNQGNGYKGWLNADDPTIASWHIVNLPGPVVPTPPDPCAAVKTQLAAANANLTAVTLQLRKWEDWYAARPR